MKDVIASLSISPYHSTCGGSIWFLIAFTNTIDQNLVVVTYARQHVVILHKDAPIRSSQLLPWQDPPSGTLFQHRYAAAILHPRSVVIWKLNCLSEHITSTLVTVSSCKSRTVQLNIISLDYISLGNSEPYRKMGRMQVSQFQTSHCVKCIICWNFWRSFDH